MSSIFALATQSESSSSYKRLVKFTHSSLSNEFILFTFPLFLVSLELLGSMPDIKTFSLVDLENRFDATHNNLRARCLIGIDVVISTYYYCVSLLKKCPYSQLFWSAFSAFGLNTERYSVFSPNAGKTRTRITPNMDIFYPVFNAAG